MLCLIKYEVDWGQWLLVPWEPYDVLLNGETLSDSYEEMHVIDHIQRMLLWQLGPVILLPRHRWGWRCNKVKVDELTSNRMTTVSESWRHPPSLSSCTSFPPFLSSIEGTMERLLSSPLIRRRLISVIRASSKKQTNAKAGGWVLLISSAV